MVSAQVTIHTPHGLHLRPAGELAEEALKYRCRVSLAHGDKEISAEESSWYLKSLYQTGYRDYRCL